jgi:hypothetical protein
LSLSSSALLREVEERSSGKPFRHTSATSYRNPNCAISWRGIKQLLDFRSKNRRNDLPLCELNEPSAVRHDAGITPSCPRGLSLAI